MSDFFALSRTAYDNRFDRNQFSEGLVSPANQARSAAKSRALYVFKTG